MTSPTPNDVLTASGIDTPERRAARAAKVRAQQVRSVYLQSPATTFGSLIAGALLVAVMWPEIPAASTVLWALALCMH
jgi:hypothetical protein